MGVILSKKKNKTKTFEFYTKSHLLKEQKQ